MATNTPPTPTTPTATYSEAPASATAKVISPNGYEWLVTMRSTRVSDLLTEAGQLEAWLGEHGWHPAPTGRASTASSNGNGQTSTDEAAPVCAIHGKPMTRRSKDARTWWSCAEKLPDGQWCPYRPPKS